jgi:hypothetical protein
MALAEGPLSYWSTKTQVWCMYPICSLDRTRYQRSALSRMATGLPFRRFTTLAAFPSGKTFTGAAPLGCLIRPERASGIDSGDPL